MAARFVDPKEIRSVDQLSAVQREQLRTAGKAYDGLDLSAEARLAGEAPEEVEGSFLGFCTLWKVVEGSTHLYDAWFFMVDSGAIFRASTIEQVASIVQFGLECESPPIRLQLGTAMVHARLLPVGDKNYKEFAAELSRQTS